MDVKINENVVRKLETAARQALLDTANFYVSLVKATIKQAQGADTGELINSIFVRQSGDLVQVWSKTVQAVIMEFWRRPLAKRPPMQALVPRLKRRGIVNGSKLEDLSSKDKGIVYVMARSIGEKGIKPRKYFSETYEQNLPRLNSYFVERFTFYFTK